MPAKKQGSKKRTSQTKKPTAKRKTKQASAVSHEFTGVILLGLAIFLGFAFYSDGMGMVGQVLKNLSMGLIGVFTYAFPPLLFVIGTLIIADLKKRPIKNPVGAIIIGIIALLSLIHTVTFKSLDMDVNFFPFIGNAYKAGVLHGIGGGAIGALLSYVVYVFMGKTACYLIFIVTLLVCLMIITSFSIKATTRRIAAAGKQMNDQIKKRRQTRLEQAPPPQPKPKKERKLYVFNGEEDAVKADGELDEMDRIETRLDTGKRPVLVPTNIQDGTAGLKDEWDGAVKAADSTYQPDAGMDIQIEDYQAEDHEAEPYVKPPYGLLKTPPSNRGKRGSESELRAQAQTLEDTLRSFNLDAKVVNICRGPVVTRFEVSPAPGVRVSRIVSLADDIALNLAAQSIRIEAPIPGRAAIGIEVPNGDIAMVYLKELIDTAEFRNIDSMIAFGLGKDITGKKIYADIAQMPHLLVAGATGAGKSVCINSIIMSVLYNATPEDVRMILIDPKVVELSVFNDIPHLLVPVVTDPKKAASAINWAVVEMQRRYQMFAANESRSIDEYNEKAFKEGNEKVPKILVIIDELSDLMMVAAREMEDAICRIAQLGRACGIHLIIATQRPSVDVITGTIKANIPSRIAFAVSSHTDSRTIIDMGGAEKLLGRGDMLYYPTGKDRPIRIQGCFVTHTEVNAVASFLKSEKDSPYDKQAVDNIKNGTTSSGPSGGLDEADELLPRAVETVLEYEQASISMLQRRLRVGYARAARLIDEMELRQIVSKSEGPKPRQVLIGWEQYREMFQKDN